MKATPTQEERLTRLQKVAKAAGGVLLSKTYVDSKTFYEWKCAKGHIWTATPGGQGKNRWCPKCGNARRAAKKTSSTDEINLRLSVRGIKLAGEYDPKVQLQSCICLVCEKPTKASFARIPKGYGCKSCLRKIQPKYLRKTDTDVVSELQSYKVTLLGVYEGVSKPLKLKCNTCGDDFSRSLDNLRRTKKHLCEESITYRINQATMYLKDNRHTFVTKPISLDKLVSMECQKCHTRQRLLYSEFRKRKIKCQNCAQDNKLGKIRKKAQSRGGELLSTRFVTVNSKYRFKCAEGHTWKAIGSGKSWCPKCAGKGKDIRDIQSLARKRGGKLLSKTFIGVDRKYDFQCSLGHDFSMTFAKMQGGQWCSICSKGSKSEELVRVTMEQIFGVKFKRIRPQWLNNDLKVPMELDGYAEELKIAFEYQGRQHYEEMSYLISHDLERIQKNDELKSKICAARGVSLFIFTHEDNYRNFPKIAEQQAKEFKLPLEKYDFSQKIDFDRAYIRTDRLKELKERAATKGLKVLSKKWLGLEHYYKVECQVCKKSYEVAGTAFMYKRINGCRYCRLVKNNNKSTLTIDIPTSFAKKHKGKLLDTEYKNMHAPMRWRCHKGHEFTARFNNMVRRDEFCAICEDRPMKNQFNKETATKRFMDFGLILQGDFKGVGIAVSTICKKCKNINSSRLNAIIKGSPPCLYCSGQRIDQKTAFATLKKYGLKPLGKYVNSYKPILCKCLTCGLEKSYKTLEVKANARGCNHKPNK